MKRNGHKIRFFIMKGSVTAQLHYVLAKTIHNAPIEKITKCYKKQGLVLDCFGAGQSPKPGLNLLVTAQSSPKLAKTV